MAPLYMEYATDVDLLHDGGAFSLPQTLGDADLNQIAERIRGRTQSCSLDMLAIGADLIAAKGRLGHGDFGNWLKVEFGWTARTAQNFMAAASAFGSKAKSVAHLPVSILYRLAAPSATAARDTVLQRIEKGENISANEIEVVCRDVGQQRERERSFRRIETPKSGEGLGVKREEYAIELAALSVAQIVAEIQPLKDRVAQLKGLAKPSTGFPELPDFLNRNLMKKARAQEGALE